MPTTPRRILLVSWHFPPSSEIAGKITWRLARHLALAGCDVHVLAPPLGEIGDRDESYAHDVPANLRITRSAIGTDPIRLLVGWRRRLMPWRRPRAAAVVASTAPAGDDAAPAPARRLLLDAMQAMPDRARHWIAPAARALRAILREERPDLVISVAPMLSAHLLVARANPRRFGVRWFAWSHDPDMLNPYLSCMPAWRNRRVAAWEERALRAADRLLVTTARMGDAYAQQLPGIASPAVLPCGYDPGELVTGADAQARAGDCLVVAHVGTLYGHRSPLPLLESLARLVARGELQAGELLLRFVGKLENAEGTSLMPRARQLGVAGFVEVGAAVPQAEALAVIRDAHVGLVLAEDQPLQVPAKIFEYLGLQRPVLALGDGATADLVTQTGVGFACTREHLDATLLAMLACWRADRFAAQRRNLATHAGQYAMPEIVANLLAFVDSETPMAGAAA